MATVLPFDPTFRRRTPPRPRVAAAATPGRDTPLPRRAMRAVAASIEPALARPLVAEPIDERALAWRFFPLLLLVAALDLATKALAVRLLAGAEWVTSGPFALGLVFNRGTAGGLSLGDHTRAINFASTGIVVGVLVMLAPVLARIDRRAPVALALAAGGGLGNLVSLAQSSRGVPDFLGVRYGAGALVVNVADLAMLAGLVLLCQPLLGLIRAIRVHGAGASLAGRAVGRRGAGYLSS